MVIVVLSQLRRISVNDAANKGGDRTRPATMGDFKGTGSFEANSSYMYSMYEYWGDGEPITGNRAGKLRGTASRHEALLTAVFWILTLRHNAGYGPGKKSTTTRTQQQHGLHGAKADRHKPVRHQHYHRKGRHKHGRHR